MITQILPDVETLKGLVPFVGFLFYMHKQALKKLDDVVESNHEIRETVIKQGVQLEMNGERFDRIEKIVDKHADYHIEAKQRFHDTVNSNVTHEQLRLLLEDRERGN